MSPALKELVELLARAAYQQLDAQQRAYQELAGQAPAGAEPRGQVTESRGPS